MSAMLLVRTLSLVGVLLPSFSECYRNPVLATNSPDPGVLALPGGGYLATATSDHATDPGSEAAFPLYFSPDLVTWELRGAAFPAGAWPPWAAKNMWAPEIHFVSGRFLLYFCASSPNGRHSIGVAVSTSGDPFGPYSDLGVPLVYHNEDSLAGPIDPSYFLDPATGSHYLLWKTDHMVNPRASQVLIRQLNPDGVSFVEGSKPHELLKNELISELGMVEGPWMIHRDKIYYLFYSSSMMQLASYHVGVARANHLLGPYTKRDTPVIQTDWDRFDASVNCSWVGPGHGSLVEDKAGTWWLVYHSWQWNHLNRDPGRLMLLDKIVWEGFPSSQLWPRVEGGVPSDTDRDPPVVSSYQH